MRMIGGTWLNAGPTQAVMAMLEGGGKQAYFVGGCVRNALLDAPVSDVDICTDARPDQITKLAQAAGMRAIPTGIDHGTVTVVVDDIAHEITTFRKDVKTDGRRAEVVFANSMKEDAHRRDFTMNALYADRSGKLFDPLGSGLSDLSARRVRFIDDATARIREDYLRILRFFRFNAWYGDTDAGFDTDALAAIGENLDGLSRLSRERVGAEMLKLLTAPDPAPAIAAMERTGVLAQILPGARAQALAPLVHLEAGRAANPIRRLAALGGEEVGERLRLSRKAARQLQRLRHLINTPATIEEIAYRNGADTAVDTALLRAALLETPLPDKLSERAQQAARQVFPVKAANLAGRAEGPSLGRMLREMEAAWIASNFTLTREELLHRAG